MPKTALQLWGPAPAGVDLTQNQNANIIGSIATVMFTALVAVELRLWARLSRSGPGIGADDYLIAVAFVSN